MKIHEIVTFDEQDSSWSHELIIIMAAKQKGSNLVSNNLGGCIKTDMRYLQLCLKK